MRSTQMSGWGQKAHPKVRECLGGPPGGPELFRRPPGGLGWVGRPSRRSWRGREAHPTVWEGSVGPPKDPGGVGRGPLEH